MPRPRPHELTRLLGKTRQGIYALDDDRRIIYFNEAASRWSGYAAEEMIGLRCQYHSSLEATGAAALACALAPPPEVMAGAAQSMAIACRACDQQPLQALVHFIPLPGEKEEVCGVVALLIDNGDSASDDAADARDAHGLHVRIQRLRQQFRERYQINHLLGASPAVVRARQQAELAAHTTASVLIVGPPGSGREYLARAIHYSQSTSGQPLVPLACPLVGAELLSSTIAALANSTVSTLAGRATLLLNNVDQLAAPLQEKLPAQLAAAAHHVRLLATARQPLTALASAGGFDVALAHVLSTLTIELPPLRERLDDLPLLAQLFLEECNARGGRQVGRFSEKALELLTGHPWHGNLDELDQIVRQAHQQCQATVINPDDLPPVVAFAADAAARPRPPEETIVLEDFLAAIERELIERALRRAKGNKTRAAHLLGMTRPKLYRRLVQLGLIEAEAPSSAEKPAAKIVPLDETLSPEAFEIADDEMFASD